MKIESNGIIDSVCVHKFIETPDRFYINTASYDKNFSKIQSDYLGVDLNNTLQSASNPNNYGSGGYKNYKGSENRNMIGSNVVQVYRQEYTRRSGVVNGVIRDSKYNNIYHVLTGTDKYMQLLSVDESTKKMNLTRISDMTVGGYYKYHASGCGYTEILTQTDDCIYILAPARHYDHWGSYNSSWIRGSVVSKVRKNSLVNSLKFESYKYCCETDETAYGSYANHQTESRAYKIYEDSKNCIVICATVSGAITMIRINKSTDELEKFILVADCASSATNPCFVSDGFVKDGKLYTYCVSNKKIYLISMKIDDIDKFVKDYVTVEECDIDLGLVDKFFDNSGNYLYFTCHLVINNINDNYYGTVFITREGNAYNSSEVESVITYKVSSDLTKFELTNVEKEDERIYNCNIMRVDDNRIITVNKYGLKLYAFNKIKERYEVCQNAPIGNLDFVTKTVEGRIFAQSRNDAITEVQLKSKINIDVEFDKKIYTEDEAEATVTVSISNELGDYIDNAEVDLLLHGCVFEDNLPSKTAHITGGKTSFKVKIKDSKVLKANVLNFRRNKVNENIR